MGKEKKDLNPADAFRKKERKKDIEKSKKNQATVREVRGLLNDPAKINAEIAKTQKLSNENKLDKGLKDKIAELKAMKEVALQKQKVMLASGKSVDLYEESKPSSSSSQAPGKLRRPEDSVYYHPEFNRTGAPPPGQPIRYKDYVGVPPPPPPRPAFMPLQMMMMAPPQQQQYLLQQQQMLYQQQMLMQQQPYSYLSSGAPAPPPPPQYLPAPTLTPGSSMHPSMLPRPMMATASAAAPPPPPPPPSSLLAQLQAQSQLAANKPPRKERPRKATFDPLDPAGDGYTERFGAAPKPVPVPEPVRTTPLYPVIDYARTAPTVPAAVTTPSVVQFVPASDSSGGGGGTVATAQDKETLLRSMYFVSDETDVQQQQPLQKYDDRYYDNMNNEEDEEQEGEEDDYSSSEESSDDSEESDNDDDEEDEQDPAGNGEGVADYSDAAAPVAVPSFVPPPLMTLNVEELMRRRHQAPPPAEEIGEGPSLPSAADLMKRRFQVPSITAEDDEIEHNVEGPSFGPSVGPSVGPSLPSASYSYYSQASDQFDDDPEGGGGAAVGPSYDEDGDEDDAEDVYVSPAVVSSGRKPSTSSSKAGPGPAASGVPGGLLGLMDYGDDEDEEEEDEEKEREEVRPTASAAAGATSVSRPSNGGCVGNGARSAVSAVSAAAGAAPPARPVSINLPKVVRTDSAITALVPNILKVKRQQQQQQQLQQFQPPSKQARMEEPVVRRPVYAYQEPLRSTASAAPRPAAAVSMDAEMDAFMSEINDLGEV